MPTRKGKKPRTQQQQQQSVPGAVGGAAGSTSGDHDSDAATDAGAAAASANPSKSVQPQKDAPRSKLEKNQAKKKRRKANKEEHAKLQLDIDVEDLIYSDINKESGKLETVKLMDKIEKEALQIYPHLGKRTYRVPAVYINSVQDASSSKDGNIFESQTKAPQQCDYRSDRAESFVGDCVYTLSEEVFLNSAVGPFFIIACYQYQHYLARLKDHFQHHPQTQGNTNEIPNIEEVSDADKSATESAEGGKQDKIKGRGEIDLMILTRNHVVFVQIKAVGDNFQEYVTQDSSILKQLKKIHTQLSNDLRVFSHVMKNVLSEPGEEGNDGGAGGGGEPTKFGRPKMSFVGIVPNLERSRVNECFEKNPDLLQAYKDLGILVLTKDEMPIDRYNIKNDFQRFSQWWKNEVFSYALKEDGSLLPALKNLTLDDDGAASEKGATSAAASMDSSEGKKVSGKLDDRLKVLARIVGRFVGLLSVVQVSKTTKLSPIRVEARTEGQTIWYIGKRFSDIVLTPRQRDYMDREDRLGYLSGPPGSGKTVVLAVRGQKWILHYHAFVVIINMYRGCSKGRILGRHMYNTITDHFDREKKQFLESHCLEFSVDVDSFCGKNLEQLKQVMKEKFGDDLGVDGSNLLFLVDETYVQDYWNSVYQPLRDNFKSSSMWCAGLFGREPERFTPFPLSQVIRCPPAIQRVLYLIDWVKDRKQHYFGADKQDSCDSTPVPCEGASVVTVRHLTCHKDSALHPSQCRECGKELADILDKLDVEKPTVGPDRPDQKLWTLRLSDIVFLVGMPRSLSRVDAKDETRKYRGIRLSDYEKFMQSYENCAMIKEVEKRGYPVKVHTDVSCPGMLPPRSSAGESLASAGYATAMPGDSGGLDLPAYQRINVTWVFAYQGMENKVILFLPGDHAKPQGPDIPEEWTNPELNIPSPGLLNDISEGQEKAQAREGDKAECFIASGIKSDDDDDDDDDVEAPEEGMDTGECKDMAAEAEPLQFKTSERDFEEKDLEDFGRWDLNNLLIAGSRSTSLLIIVTCGKKEMIIKPMKTNT